MTDRLSDIELWNNYYQGRKSKRFLPNPCLRLSHFELDRLFRKYLPQQPGLKLLEVGCGASIWLPYFAKNFDYNVSGIDYSEYGCRRALENLHRAGYIGNVFQGDFLEPSDNLIGQFDIVFSSGVIEHFSQPEEVVEIFNTYLKCNGIIISYVPNFIGMMGSLMRFIDQKFYNTHNIFSLDDLIKFHSVKGFEIVYASYMQFLDLSILTLSRFGQRIAKLFHAIFAGLNLPTLFLNHFLNSSLKSEFLSSTIIAIARKIH